MYIYIFPWISEGKEQNNIKYSKDKFNNHFWNFDGLKLEFDVENWQVTYSS